MYVICFSKDDKNSAAANPYLKNIIWRVVLNPNLIQSYVFDFFYKWCQIELANQLEWKCQQNVKCAIK